MFNFIKNAMTELEHVVWPTPTETKKYMTYTVGVIVVLATFLAILGYGIRMSLSGVRNSDIFPHSEVVQSTASGEEDLATREYMSGILENIETKKTASGITTEVNTGAAQ